MKKSIREDLQAGRAPVWVVCVSPGSADCSGRHGSALEVQRRRDSASCRHDARSSECAVETRTL